jgi:nucleoside-diphosphate-sugar epimerase
VLGARTARAGNAYFVTDGEPVVFREFLSELLATQGVSAPERRVPAPVAHVLAAGGEALWRMLPLRGQPPMTRFAYWASSQQCTIRIDKARTELGYEPVRSIDEGLAELRADGATARSAPSG